MFLDRAPHETFAYSGRVEPSIVSSIYVADEDMRHLHHAFQTSTTARDMHLHFAQAFAEVFAT